VLNCSNAAATIVSCSQGKTGSELADSISQRQITVSTVIRDEIFDQ
jgi:hypothetical protein